VAKEVAGATRMDRMAILLWSGGYFLLRKFFQFSNKRLLGFLSEVDAFEQKHSLVVLRKYIAMHKKKRKPVGRSRMVKALEIKGNAWARYVDLISRAGVPENDLRVSLFQVGLENYGLWSTQASALDGLVNGANSKFFTDIGSASLSAIPGAGVGYATLKAFTGMMIREWRDYISLAGQAVSVVSYLVWRTRTYYKLDELRETLVSMDRVKMAVGEGLSVRDAANLDAEWTMKAVRTPGYPRLAISDLDNMEDEDWQIDLARINWANVA
jgi:hypothetical protein